MVLKFQVQTLMIEFTMDLFPTDFEVFNGGMNYDVVNPPQIEISAGTGTTALVEPIIEGSVKQIFVDPQDFDVQKLHLFL